MKKTLEIESKLIAFCIDDGLDDCVEADGPGYYLECLRLDELEIGSGYDKKRRYVVSYDVNKFDCGGDVPDCWEKSYESFTAAWNEFKASATRGNVFGKVHLIDNFMSEYGYLYDDETPYCSSATAGDYGPGNPWDAPGMKVSDFIRGVGP